MNLMRAVGGDSAYLQVMQPELVLELIMPVSVSMDHDSGIRTA